MLNLKYKVKSFIFEKAMEYVSGNPEENLPKLLKWGDEFDRSGNWESQRKVFHSIIDDPKNIWYQYIMQLYKDIDNDIIQTTFKNFMINAVMAGYAKQKEMEKNMTVIYHGRY